MDNLIEILSKDKRKIDDDKRTQIEALLISGETYDSISDTVGVSKNTITTVKRNLKQNIAEKGKEAIVSQAQLAIDIQSSRTHSLTTIATCAITNIPDEIMAKATLSQRATFFGTIFDKIRLIQGESTSNLSTQSTIVTKVLASQEEFE